MQSGSFLLLDVVIVMFVLLLDAKRNFGTISYG